MAMATSCQSDDVKTGARGNSLQVFVHALMPQEYDLYVVPAVPHQRWDLQRLSFPAAALPNVNTHLEIRNTWESQPTAGHLMIQVQRGTLCDPLWKGDHALGTPQNSPRGDGTLQKGYLRGAD